MGFDIFISLNLLLDPKSGQPYTYSDEGIRCPVSLADFTIPEQFRKYVQMRGSHFHDYIKPFNGYIVSVEDFLDKYPEWTDNNEYWTKANHDGFKEALEWFVKKKVSFNISWSY